MKLYAYSDDDGYIHWNVLKGESIWCHQTKTYLKREHRIEKANYRECLVRFIIQMTWLALFLILFLGGKS